MDKNLTLQRRAGRTVKKLYRPRGCYGSVVRGRIGAWVGSVVKNYLRLPNPNLGIISSDKYKVRIGTTADEGSPSA